MDKAAEPDLQAVSVAILVGLVQLKDIQGLYASGIIQPHELGRWESESMGPGDFEQTQGCAEIVRVSLLSRDTLE